MTQSSLSQAQIIEFLAQVTPFEKLGKTALEKLASQCELLRYRMGQPILEMDKMPAYIAVIYEGQARLLGNDHRVQSLVSLQKIGPGTAIGWVSLLRGIACETAIASTESICICIPTADFLDTLDIEPDFNQYVRSLGDISEIFELWSLELKRRPEDTVNLKDSMAQLLANTVVVNVPTGRIDVNILDTDLVWLVSSGNIEDFPVGSRLVFDGLPLIVQGLKGARLIGTPEPQVHNLNSIPVAPPGIATPPETVANVPAVIPAAVPTIEVKNAPDRPPAALLDTKGGPVKYPFIRGYGRIDAPLACFQMLGRHLGVNYRKDIIRKVLDNQLKTSGQITLYTCGAIATMMGLNAQLVNVNNAIAIPRLKAPVIIQWRKDKDLENEDNNNSTNSFAILFSVNERELVVGIPEEGIRRFTPENFIERWGDQGQVLLVEPRIGEQKEKFSFWWFVPALLEHRKVIIEVFIASFFVQMFGLANPLITQVIIDKVLGQRSLDTLDALGVLMLVVALFEGVLNTLRTLSFVDATNRIDLKLGSQVIDHLLRLPLNYFDRRRVGDMIGRVNELGNIRGFLTGTALTVVLDAVFSLIYIGVMISYSLILTVVALGSVPFFAVLMIIVTPIVRKLLLQRAERYADAQSYLVEVVSGIQTVKAQTIELKSRWRWYERYAKFMKSSFKTTQISTVAGTFGSFLNTLSSLALLWVGAHLVIKNEITLGQLIAFRIISGNVTGSLLRFVQVWQSFQEVGMSIERLRDVMDSEPEADEEDRNNIPMPDIQGTVKFDKLSFCFLGSPTLQLANVDLEFPAGTFVGIVGQSGSGKSTLMKLLQRLYDPTQGRIQIDGYDISKVELYSLRGQMGMVLQDTLLFNGSVQENIALNKPDATTDEIIEAAKIAVAHDFIMGLPQGYNTNVGERGSTLSGGQRQRLAIARTVLQNPNLLILDEATSALDYNSERQVCENLAVAFAGRTVFFITHRLPTVRNADVIILMEQGIVAEKGTHDELIKMRGRYYALYQQQEAQS